MDDDWEIYSSGLDGKTEPPLSILDLIEGAPVLCSLGGHLLGRDFTSVFLVDATLGRILYVFMTDDRVYSPKTNDIVPMNRGVGSPVNYLKIEKFLFIPIRIYALRYKCMDKWHFKFGDSENFRCEITESPLDCIKNGVVYKLGEENSIERLFDLPIAEHPIEEDSSSTLYLVVSIVSLSIMLAFYWIFFLGKRAKSNKKPEEHKLEAVSPKKKINRKRGKSKKGDSLSIAETGRKIGNILVKNREIAKGSDGTVAWEGVYEGRQVAVKRVLRTHHSADEKEVENLIASDSHPNIVRFYGIEQDVDFIYLALELCDCSLDELICTYADSPQGGQNSRDDLWRADGYPTTMLLNIMRDMVWGLSHLHGLGIIHRDLKPQNVLIIKQGSSIRAKVSDMGISKRLPVDMSSLTNTGGGTPGWQAPEQIKRERQTTCVDMFSLGCSLYFCLTGGQHPFGDGFERERNIEKDEKDLFLINHIPEAVDLISKLLDPKPSLRPKAVDVLNHPLFWDAEKRLSFLRDASDRLECEDINSKILSALESTYSKSLGGKWDAKLDSAFINDLGSFRKYKFNSVRDLLRVIRNKLNHYEKLSQVIQELLGQPPEGFYNYFSNRFPQLFFEVYKVIEIYCGEEKKISKYFKTKQA